MPEHGDLPTNVWNGRIVSQQVYWWLKNTQAMSTAFFCIHNVPLTKICQECNG